MPIESLGDAVLAVRVLERVLNRQFHIGRPHLGDHRAIDEFHKRMDNRLRMNHDFDLLRRQIEQPA